MSRGLMPSAHPSCVEIEGRNAFIVRIVRSCSRCRLSFRTARTFVERGISITALVMLFKLCGRRDGIEIVIPCVLPGKRPLVEDFLHESILPNDSLSVQAIEPMVVECSISHLRMNARWQWAPFGGRTRVNSHQVKGMWGQRWGEWTLACTLPEVPTLQTPWDHISSSINIDRILMYAIYVVRRKKHPVLFSQ